MLAEQTNHSVNTKEALPEDKPCQLEESQKLNQNNSAGRLLSELKDKLRDEKIENPDSEATKLLERNISLIDKEYNDIPKIIKDYDDTFGSFLESLKTLSKSRDKLHHLLNDQGDLLEKLGKLRTEQYDSKEKSLKDNYAHAVQELMKDGSCLDQAMMVVEKHQRDYQAIKGYKDKISSQLKELADLYKQSDTSVQSSNYKVVGAYFTEAEAILNNTVSENKDANWLKNELANNLINWIRAENDRFVWHKKKLEEDKKLKNLQQQVDRTKLEYENFQTNRKALFIREAQDI